MNGSNIRTSPEIAGQESLGGQHLRVLMLEYPPFLYIDQHSNGSKTYRGICRDLMVTVAAALNFTFLRPLFHLVWLVLLVAYVITSLCLWGLPAISNRFSKTQQPSWTLQETLWYAMGAVLCQEGKIVSSQTVWRCIAISWWYTMLVPINVYVGNLVAFTATKEYCPPFNTLQEMVNQQEYEYGVEHGIFIEKLFKNASFGEYKQIGKYITTNDDSFSSNTATGIHRAVNTKYAFIGEFSPLVSSIAEYCNVTLIKEQFYSGRWSSISRKRWKHLAELDQISMKLVEAGMMEMWRQKHWPVSSCCGQGTFAAFSPVNMHDVATVFAALLSGLDIALMLLIIENIMKVHIKKKGQSFYSNIWRFEHPNSFCEELT